MEEKGKMMSYSYLPWGGSMPREGTGIGPSIRACRVSAQAAVSTCVRKTSPSVLHPGHKVGRCLGLGFHGRGQSQKQVQISLDAPTSQSSDAQPCGGFPHLVLGPEARGSGRPA